MKLFYRFFLILLAFSLLPVAGMGLWMLSTRQAVHDNARFLHGRLASLLADSAERMLEQMNHTLGVVQDLEIAHGQEKIEIPALRRAAAADPEVALISILDARGVEVQRLSDPDVYPDSARVDRSSETLVSGARVSGRLSIGPPVAVAGRALIPVVHPLADGRALYMMYSLRGLQRRLKGFADGGRGRVLFADADGRPVVNLGDAPPAPDWRLPADGDWWDGMPSADGPWVAASAPVPALGWRAVSLQLRHDAYAESEAAAASAVLFGLTLCALVAGGAFALSKLLLQPVTALIGGADRVARGDFSRPLPHLGWGELETLGRNFNEMSDKVRRFQDLQIERILEEKAKVEALVRNIPAGVLLVGLDGKIAYANLTAARVLGATGSVPKDSDLARAAGIKTIVDAVRINAKIVDTTHIEMRAANGEVIAVFACRAFPVRRENREIGVLVLMREVTVERELERMKEEFFHAVVHDLRGPITVIDGVVFFLKKLKLGEREARYIEMAHMASLRLAGLITNILDIAKLESGTMILATSRFAADSLLASAYELNRVPGEGKGVTVEVAPSTAGELVGDSKLLDRVLMNLVGNALKFTPSGGRITIGALSQGDEVEFFVRDTGPGIPADKVDAVFEKFKQLDRDTAARAGYGLGLSICKKIVEVHGGRIWVESQEGQGSRFAFRIPRSGSSDRKTEVLSSPAA
jgi:signal transduction histidine kinase/HAMP domain-containing protein